ncbi:MAG TPA: M23 family metallopeptidase [Intrasporangiaceae bacterium]|nr:M23 family metallopeptidase [Intrasporangiaceae bacterium]
MRLAAAVLVWLVAFALLLAAAPRGVAQPTVGLAAQASAVAGRGDAGVWAWPLAPLPQVVRPFEKPSSAYGPGHRGIDLAGSPGQPVLAVADGVVTHSGVIAGRGTVSVLHSSGIRSTYEPVDERIEEGSAVAAGATLGTLGTGSHCAGCLHLGARLGEDYLDPLLLLTRVRIILLPLLPDG